MSRKKGKFIKNKACINPLGIKSNRYEIDARTALLALDSGCAAQEHLVALWTLADLSQRISKDLHIMRHADSVKKLCELIHQSDYHCSGLSYESIKVSSDILLRWILLQKNSDISKFARQAIKEIENEKITLL